MTAETTRLRYRTPPVVLTFLAPATQCNQHCPACIIDRVGEPVRTFERTPTNFADILRQFLDAKVPVLSVSFQGYEVTLPRSWPYVEAVFELAQKHSLRRSFISNGMLIARHVRRIVELGVTRISISLDGADAATNDRLRGLNGAFAATTSNLRQLLRTAPELASRIAIVSTVYDEENATSLRRMPALLEGLGIHRWALGFELRLKGDVEVPVQSRSTLTRWLTPLRTEARKRELRFHVNDELGFLQTDPSPATDWLGAKGLFDPRFLVRVDPSGHLRTGLEVTQAWRPNDANRWEPSRNAVQIVRYHEHAAAFRSQRQTSASSLEPRAD